MTHLRFALVISLLAQITWAGCGGSASTTVLSPSSLDGRCGVTLAVSSSSIGAAGGAGVVRVQTNRECSWSIPQRPPWVKLSQPASLQGSAEIAFVVDENRSTSMRSWEVVIGDQRAVISQEAATCTWSLSPAKLSIDASGGDAEALLTTQEFCSWTSPSPVSWIALIPERGQGTTEITVRVSRNNGGARRANVRVSSAAIDVAQREAPGAQVPVPPAEPEPPPPQPPVIPPPVPEPPGVPPPVPGCTFVVAPIRFTDVVATAATLQVDVTTQGECTWSSQSAVEWLRVSGNTKTGSGRVDVSVLANAGAPRTAAVAVAGQSVTIEQRGVTICAFTVTPNVFRPPSEGGSVSVSLSSPAGCAWTVKDKPSWVTVSSASGTGSAALSITAAPNFGAARTAVLMVGGRELRIEQAQAPCTYTVTPDRFDISYKKQDRKIEVTTQSHCPWSATSSASWVRVSLDTRTGSRDLDVRIEENSSRSETRTAVVTITGQSFTKTVTIAQDEKVD